MNGFISTHKLDFETAPWELGQLFDDEYDWKRFRIGTCDGMWYAKDNQYNILAIINSSPGNGHFTDVMEWFEHSCKRDKYTLRILEVWNKKLKLHLVTKRGFTVQEGTEHLYKSF